MNGNRLFGSVSAEIDGVDRERVRSCFGEIHREIVVFDSFFADEMIVADRKEPIQDFIRAFVLIRIDVDFIEIALNRRRNIVVKFDGKGLFGEVSAGISGAENHVFASQSEESDRLVFRQKGKGFVIIVGDVDVFVEIDGRADFAASGNGDPDSGVAASDIDDRFGDVDQKNL